MPANNTALHERALKRALAHESVDLVWDEVEFSATKNPLPPMEPGQLDRNSGDDTACTLTAVVSDDPAAEGVLHSDAVPEQGDTFTDGAGRAYRVAKRDWTPGLPKAVFHIPNVVTVE